MSGPSNATIGDLDEPTNLPVTTVPEDILIEEKKLAKYSKTAEFRRLKEYMEGRIKFFQTYLPDGRAINGGMDKDGKPTELVDDALIATYWRAANIVIAEFQSVLNEYQNSQEVVDSVGH
jgi:hypothetical protein